MLKKQTVFKTRSLSKGFSFIEILIVAIIIGILVVIAAPAYIKAQEKTRVQEAKTALRLIRSSQRVYQGQWAAYYGGGDFSPGGIANTELRLDLNDSPGQDWDYNTTGGATFTATARRTSGPYTNCTYQITDANPDPTYASGTCP